MLLNTTQFNGAISNIGTQKNFGFANNGKAFRTLFDTLYQDKIGSIVREVSCNAYDAHLSAGKPELPFEIHLPSIMEPFFSVKDYGIGMDEDTINEVFTIMFASTKDNDNKNVGGFGLGSKTPFAYTDNFTVISIKDGISTTYTMFLSPDGTPGYVKLAEKQTNECNGVEIIMPVNDVNDRRAFSNAITNQLHFFPVRPIIKGGDYGVDWMLEPTDSQASMIHNNIKFFATNSLAYKQRSGCFVVVGPVGYVMNFSILKEKLPLHTKILDWIQEQSVRIYFNTGEVSVTPSRETLSYDPMTLAAFDSKLDGLIDNLTKQYRDDFDAAGSLVDKAIFMSTNNSWTRRLVDKSMYDVFAKSIFKSDYNGSYNCISAEKIGELIGYVGWMNVSFSTLNNITQRKIGKQVGEFRFAKPDLKFCIIDSTRLIDRRIITASLTLNLNDVNAVMIDRQKIDEAKHKELVNKTKALLESYGFTVYLLSQFDPAKVDRDYSVIKTHGYRIKSGITFQHQIDGNISNYSTAWEKLVSKTDIEPGFFVESHYGSISEQSRQSVVKLLQLKAFKVLDDDTLKLDVFAMPVKACQKLSSDDGWINLNDYIVNVADVNVAEICHDVWIASTIKDVIIELDSASVNVLKVFDSILPIHNMFKDLKSMLLDNQILLDSYEDDILDIMRNMLPSTYRAAGILIKKDIMRYMTDMFNKFKLLPVDQIFSYIFNQLSPAVIKEYAEYVEYFGNKYPDRLVYDAFDINKILVRFPTKPV